jgi:hypothetical protein
VRVKVLNVTNVELNACKFYAAATLLQSPDPLAAPV